MTMIAPVGAAAVTIPIMDSIRISAISAGIRKMISAAITVVGKAAVGMLVTDMAKHTEAMATMRAAGTGKIESIAVRTDIIVIAVAGAMARSERSPAALAAR